MALIDEAPVIERILRHLGLWEACVRVDATREPPQPDSWSLNPGSMSPPTTRSNRSRRRGTENWRPGFQWDLKIRKNCNVNMAHA